MITPVRRTNRIGQPRWSFQHVGLSGRAGVHGWIGNTFRIFNRVAHPATDRNRGREGKREKERQRKAEKEGAHERVRDEEREKEKRGEKETKTEGE